MEKEIVICNVCNGSGKRECRELTDYHHQDYDVWDEKCGWCNGTGRLVKETHFRKLNKEELELRKR